MKKKRRRNKERRLKKQVMKAKLRMREPSNKKECGNGVLKETK